MPPLHTPDRIILAGRIWTAGGVPPGADSIAIADGRIVAVGPAGEVRALAAPRTEVTELRGGLVLPGFHDAHVHPILAGLERMRCDLSDLPDDAAAYGEAIARYARSHVGLGWIVGGGWTMAAFPGGMPDIARLDAAVPDRPVYLESRDGHSAWINSDAARLAGIAVGTPDPPLGRIERCADGSVQGTLQEHAMDLVARLLPEPDARDLDEALLLAQRYLHRLGITAWQDATVSPERLATYLRADAAGRLTARVVASLEWDEHGDLDQIEGLICLRETVPNDGRVRASTVKVFQDGVIENRTAALLEPYLDAGGRPGSGRGEARVPPDRFAAAAIALTEAGFQIHVHAIGDRAVRDALDAFEAARGASTGRDPRHHIAHIQRIDAADVPRFAALGVVANMQPFWAVDDAAIEELTRPIVGDDRTERMYPFECLRRSGARLAMGSDWSVTTPDPLQLLSVAVNRVRPDARGELPFVPSERLTLDDALRAATLGSAYVNHLDDETGAIEVGGRADLAVLDRDILAGDPGAISDAHVILTLVDGRTVHEADR